nr:zinc knuckle CX2CX4HX4C [Tanacetum cinerariifolium]
MLRKKGVSLAGTHNAIKEPSRAMSTGHGIVYSGSDILDFNLFRLIDPIVQSVDINPTPTSYIGAAGASTIGQAKVHSNFRTLVVEPICDGVNISIPRKVVEKKWSMDTRLLKEELTRIPIWVKLHDFPIQVFEADGISLIATFIGKPVILDSYTSDMCNDSWGWSSFARCLIEVNSKADLLDVVTI